MQDKRAKVSQAASQEKDNDLSSGTPNLQGSSLSETENWNSIDLRMDDADKSCNDALSSAEAMVTNDDKHVDEYNIGEVNSSVDASTTDFENLICIEIFSGSGKLTRLGMRAVAIDRSSNRTSGPVTILDLAKDEDMEFLENFIKSEKENIMLVHLAPPCGTSSAARNKRHPDLEAAGFDLPRPLRSREHPMGLPTLRGLDAAKVNSANI